LSQPRASTIYAIVVMAGQDENALVPRGTVFCSVPVNLLPPGIPRTAGLKATGWVSVDMPY